MASLFRQYLCCCLPQPRSTHDTERQPLLDPDVLPQAPPRPPPTRTTEQDEQEQQLRRNILNKASERLINILSPHPFTSLQQPSTPPSLSSPSTSPSNDLSSLSSSPTLTSHNNSRHSWRPSPHDPIAPVRVVHLGKNWEVLNTPSSQGGGEGQDPSLTPSTMRRRQRKGKKEKGRPASSHSMRTLPRGGGGGSRNQPSPLRRGGSNGENGRDLVGGVGVEEQEEFDEEEDLGEEGDNESRFGTVKSYKTAASNADAGGEEIGGDGAGGGSDSNRGSRVGLRDIWGTAMGDEQEEEVEEDDPERKEQLKKALEELERDIDDWKLKPVGPIVADLGDYKPSK